MRRTHQSHELSSNHTTKTTPVGQVSVHMTDASECPHSSKRKYQVIESSLDYDQVQERWHRDPWDRQDPESATKAVESRRNLEEAVYSQGFSQIRASQIAYYMTRCGGQFQEWDFVVKRRQQLKNRTIQEDHIGNMTPEMVSGRLDCALDEDGATDSDQDGIDIPSAVQEGRQRLQEVKATVSCRVSTAIAARKPRSYKDARQRRRDRKSEAVRIKEYANYTEHDYAQAARRYDIVYGSAEKLYRLAEDKRAALLVQAQRMSNQTTTEMMLHGRIVDAEDPTFGITLPSADEALTKDERRERDQRNKQCWAEKHREIMIRGLERRDLTQGMTMFN